MKRVILSVLFLFMPSIACAFVPHNYPEIYIHQMGHVFFFLSCLLVIMTIIRNQLQREKGWRYLFFSQIGFILWNLDTFIGHETEYWISSGQIWAGSFSNTVSASAGMTCQPPRSISLCSCPGAHPE